jgi:hypothetical protein
MPLLDNAFTRYNNVKDKDERRKEAYPYLEKKYFKQPFKVDELFDPGERVLAKKLKFFIPGRIYTWKYDPLYAKQMPYYDKRPFVLVHGQMTTADGNLIVQGLNLNYFPEPQRAQIIQIYEDAFKKDLDQAKKMVEKGQVGVMKNALLNLQNWDFITKMFDTGGKLAYEWGYRNYIIPRIMEPVLVEFGDWEILPYFIPKEFIGVPPQKVWTEYTKFRAEKMKKPRRPDPDRAKKIQKRFTKPGI